MIELFILAAMVPINVVAGMVQGLRGKNPREFFILVTAYSCAAASLSMVAIKYNEQYNLFPEYQKQVTLGGAGTALLLLVFAQFTAKRTRWPVWDGWLAIKACVKLAIAIGIMSLAGQHKLFDNDYIYGLFVMIAPPVATWFLIVGVVSLWLLIPRKARELRRPADNNAKPYGDAAPAQSAAEAMRKK